MNTGLTSNDKELAMRTPNNMLKNALLTLALASASLVASNANARSESSNLSLQSDLASAKTTVGREVTPTPMPRPEPPVVEEEDFFARADINHDGVHNMDDLILLLGQ